MVLEQDNNVLKRTTVELLRFLRDSDVKVWLDGERLRCNAPQGVLTPRLQAEISEKKAELVALLQKGADAMSSVLEPILPVPRDRNLPQSFAQQRLWFLDQLFPQSQAYYTSFCIGMKGPLQVGVLEQCLNEMVRRHESLRTTFHLEDHEPLQVVHASAKVPLPFIDLSYLASSGQAVQTKALFEQLAQQPYNLAQGPLLRLAMIKLHHDDYRLFLAMHHIIDDGWSMSIFVQEMLKLYTALVEERSSPLTELPLQYADFASWQRQTLQGDRLSRLLTYWRTQLAGAAPLLPLPTDHLRPAHQSYAGAMLTFAFSPTLTAQLKALSQREGLTLFMTLLAAFQTLLARYSGCEDILVGTPIANRTHKELEGIIGFFVNTLALRTDLSGNPSVRQLLQRVRHVALQAYAHQDLPFERLVEELQPERNLSYSPLFQVLFDFRNMRQTKLSLPGMHLWHVDVDIQKSTAFDLECDIEDDGENLSGSILYNTGLFEASTIKRMAEHFQILLKGFVEKQEQHLWDLPMLSTTERKKLLAGWRSTQTVTFLPDLCFFQLFERQVTTTPEAIAVTYNDECLTYEALYHRVSILARHFQRFEIGSEQIVAFLMQRNIDFLIAILATFRVGAAYLPLDPYHPARRLAQTLEQSGVSLVLTTDEFSPLFELTGTFVTEPSTLRKAVFSDLFSTLLETDDNRIVEHTPQNLAYVIYTSGSTGRPKGTMIEQQGMLNHLSAKVMDLTLTAKDCVAQTASQCFDISVWQFLAALVVGGRVHIFSDEVTHDPSLLTQQVICQGITILEVVPTLLQAMLHFTEEPFRDDLSTLRWVLLTGEALPPALSRAWFSFYQQISLLNAYGPTECSDDVTHYVMNMPPSPEETNIPIGRPIANLSLYILDRQLEPVSVGVVGELYVGGVGVGRGYLHEPQRTAEVFIPDPFGTQPGARLYKTGDLVRSLPDNTLVFLGRIDMQVKLRGFRIELGEIEAVATQHPQISAAVALLRDNGGDDTNLVIYVVPEEGVERASELKGYLQERLPGYMVPSQIVFLKVLPLTENGKVDRKALMQMPIEPTAPSSSLTLPRTPTEQLIADIWRRLLAREHLSTTDSFFELGGHSLLATRIMAQVCHLFQVDLSLATLFEAPTIAGLARQVERAQQQQENRLLPEIQAGARPTPLPLSFAQQRLWFLDQLEPNSPRYNVTGAVRLHGQLNEQALWGSIQALLQRHESLRTTFVSLQGVPSQLIAPSLQLPLPLIDLSGIAPEQQDRLVQALARQETLQPFALEVGPLLRLWLLRTGPEHQVLLLSLHHIITDGWSMQVLLSEVTQLYSQLLHHQRTPLPALPLQYADYALWQREWLQGERLERLLAYWRTQLQGAPSLLSLPTDFPRPLVQSFHGASCRLTLSQAVVASFKALCAHEEVTLFMGLLTAFQILLARSSGQDDLLVGIPIANRSQVELDGVLGFFANTLVLRTDVRGNPDFRTLVRRVRQVCLQAYAHQDAPFDLVVEAMQPERDLSRNPLFQVMFALQPNQQESIELEGIQWSALALTGQQAHCDLALYLDEGGEEIEGVLEYSTDLFERESIQRMIERWQLLLEGIVAAPASPLSALPFLTSHERQQVISLWNETQYPIEWPCSLPEAFEAQVKRTPEAIALVCADASLCYSELNVRANRLAHRLRCEGVRPETVVGICVERSIELIIGIVGILKAGGAYVPLDPGYPRQRLASMLTDAQIPLLLTQHSLREQLPVDASVLLELETDWEEEDPSDDSSSDLHAVISPEQLVYVIYTSGSTGQPKGVMNRHLGVLNRLHWMQRIYQLEPYDRVLQKTPVSFDVSVWEIFWPLLTGACLVLAEPGGHQDPSYLLGLITQEKITVLHFVTSMLRAFLREPQVERCSGVQQIFCSGEALSDDVQQQVFARLPGVELHNLYGPTEAAIEASFWDCRLGEMVTIGRAIDNVQLYVLDRWMEPVPIGVTGELYIGGIGVARGYLGKGEQTAESFVPDPFSREWGARLYRTGDVVQWRADGNLVFLGRLDQQVKLRGLRIELGEIEVTLRQFETVREAVVQMWEDSQGETKLVAYIVLVEQQKVNIEALRHFLRQRLPEYMLPSAFVPLSAFPFTPSGKIDTKALLAPTQVRDEADASYILPRDSIELQLVQIWQNLLQRAFIGNADNFFDLGGHSLLAVRMVEQIHEQLGVRLPLALIFKQATVSFLASQLRQQGEPLRQSALVEFRSQGTRPPFFCIHPVGGEVFCYLDLARLLDQDQPFYALQSLEVEAEQTETARIEEIATSYIEAIQRISAGPYYLGGWSLGGVIAFEMAQQLQKQGQEVKLLALMDSYVPTQLSSTGDITTDLIQDLNGLFGKDISLAPADLRQMNTRAQIDSIFTYAEKSGILSPGIGEAYKQRMFFTFKRNMLAFRRYIPQIYPGKLTIFQAREQEANEHISSASGWRSLTTQELLLHTVPGDHYTMMKHPHIKMLAHFLNGYLAE